MFGSVWNIKDNVSAYKRIVLQNLNTKENYKKLKDKTVLKSYFGRGVLL